MSRQAAPNNGDTGTAFLTKFGKLAVQWDDEDADLCVYPGERAAAVRLAPLCWVKDKPVYVGDVLVHSSYEGDITVTGKHPHSGVEGCSFYSNGMEVYGIASNLAWPKKECWVNVFKPHDGMAPHHTAFVSHGFATPELADVWKGVHSNFIKTVKISLEN